MGKSRISIPSGSNSPTNQYPHRRMLSRGSSSTSTPSSSPTRASSSSLQNLFHHHTSRSASPALQAPTRSLEQHKETDAECWERMLTLQMEYHCYNSARLEAAVEALESGCPFEKVPIRKSISFVTSNSYLEYHLLTFCLVNSFKIMPRPSE